MKLNAKLTWKNVSLPINDGKPFDLGKVTFVFVIHVIVALCNISNKNNN